MCRYGALPRISAEQIAQAFGVLPTTAPHAKRDLDVTQHCGAQSIGEAEHASTAHTHAEVPAMAPREPVVIPPVEEATVVVTVLGSTDAKYRVPMSRLHHLPAVPQRVRVLCPLYDPEHPHESCVMGDACHHVHADVRGLVVVCAHVNYAWRNLEEVTYTRHEPGNAVHIAAPNSSVEVDVMDSGSLLVTKALESHRRPLTHCAHYYLNRRCNLGPDCRFVHAVFVNETARPRQRAPAPVQLGREILPTRRSEVSALSAMKSESPAPAYSSPHRVSSISAPVAAVTSHPMPVHATSDHGSSLHAASPSESHRSGSTTPELRGNSPRGRWRHDPYSMSPYAYVFA